MSITRQLLLLFFVSFISEVISGFLPFIFPSSLMSMLLVFGFLCFKLVKLEDIEPVGVFLQKNISIFFLPPAVSLMEEWDFI
ncbi:MAG: CidA/LrgA family protein, partial [bacterium]